jgi:uncharacterized protein
MSLPKRNKLSDLKSSLRSLGSVVVAYSGGLDSTFLLKAAVDTLGKDKVLAVTARSETYPAAEYLQAVRTARAIGARHIVINTEELKSEKFLSNPIDRCYYCKRELFGKLIQIRKKYGLRHVVDGSNADDLKDIRHGSRAAKALGIKKPLLKAGLTKADISRLSKKQGLPTWDKPAAACLASRFPFKNRITKDALSRIDKAEAFMKKLGFRQVRVRMHDPIARIEVGEKELVLGLERKKAILKKLKDLGFIYVALDLEGYRTGSMHEAEKA